MWIAGMVYRMWYSLYLGHFGFSTAAQCTSVSSVVQGPPLSMVFNIQY